MSRLWDKGLPLDEKILKYTAGEDHILDHRLVSYDIKASDVDYLQVQTSFNYLNYDIIQL